MKNKITAIILAFVLISVAYGATRSLVPRADSEGGLGTSSKWWLEAYIDTIYTEVLDVNGTATIGTLTLADGSITDSGGAISFGNENLSTTGTGTFGFNGIKLLDEDTGYYINLRVEDDTTTGQDRFLEFDVGNASRILNITGDPTLADWFDQSVKVAANPTFASVITNLLDTTGAADMDYGSADVTDHTFIADGGTAIIDGSFQFPDADGSPSAAGELQYDNTVANWDDGALCWYDDDEVKYLVDLATLPTNDDYVVAYDAAIDKFYMKADADTGGATAYDDIGDPDAASSITFADGETVTWATAEDSAGSFFTIDDSDAALAANTYLMHLLYSVDDDEANADYFKCEDAGGVVLSIQQNGDLASTGKVDLNPAHTATATIIDITPSAVISTNEAVWNAVIIDGAALDPSGDDVLVCGMGIDFSGVVPSGSGGNIDGIQVRMADGNEHSIHSEEGKIVIDNTAGSAAGAEYTAVDIRLNTASLNTNSDIHAIDVAVEAGTPAGKVVALGTHTNVNPIAQSIGTFSTPNQTEYAGERHTGGTVWADGVDGSEIFIADDDAVYVGSAAVFNEIEVDMATAATKSVTPTFHYNTAADTWTEFFPADDTDGFQQDGTVRWDLDDISGSWTSDGDPCGTDTSTGYWIKVVRTANADPGTPTPTTIKTGVITSYSWDKTGAIDVLSVEGDTITEGGVAVYNDDEMDAFSELDAIVTDKSLVNMADGATWLGVHSFGGATTAIPWKVNATAAPTVEGQAIWESDTDELTVGDGSISIVIAAKTNTLFAFNIHDIDSGMDDIKMPLTRAVVITKVTAFVTGGTNVVGRLYEVDGDGDDADAVGVESSDWTFTAGETEDSSFNNATFDAGDYIQWDTTSVSGSVTGFMISVEGYEI